MSQVWGTFEETFAGTPKRARASRAWNRRSAAATARDTLASAISAGAAGRASARNASSRPFLNTPRHRAPNPHALSSANAAFSVSRSRNASVPRPKTRSTTGPGSDGEGSFVPFSFSFSKKTEGTTLRSVLVMPPVMGSRRASSTPDHVGRSARHTESASARNTAGSRSAGGASDGQTARTSPSGDAGTRRGWGRTWVEDRVHARRERRG